MIEFLRAAVRAFLRKPNLANTAGTAISQLPSLQRVIVSPRPYVKNQNRFLTRQDALDLVYYINQRHFNGRLESWVDEAVAIMFVESGSSFDFNARADRLATRREPDGRTSYGLMQVLLPTAQDLYKKGYKAFPATSGILKTQEGGVYFGLAYIDWLTKNFRSLLPTKEDIIRAYNGGAGWKRSQRGTTMTLAYYNKFNRQYDVTFG